MKILKKSFKEAFPELSKQWHPTKNKKLKPEDFTPGSDKKIWWQGLCGHNWKAIINSRTRGRGCPYCSNKLVLFGFNDITTLYPEIAKQWCYERNKELKPSDFMAGSAKKAWWIGPECGHEWESPIRSRTTKGSGCLVCCGKQVLIGFNDLNTTHPELAKQWHPTKNGNIKSCLFFKEDNQDLVITQYIEDHKTKDTLKTLLDEAMRQTAAKRILLHIENSSLTKIHTDLDFEFLNETPITFTYLDKHRRTKSSKKQDLPKVYDAGKSVYTLQIK